MANFVSKYTGAQHDEAVRLTGVLDGKVAKLSEEIANLGGGEASTEWRDISNYSDWNQYIDLSVGVGNAVDPNPIIKTSGGFCWQIILVKKGDKFRVTGRGGAAPRLWGFTDANYILLSVAIASYDVQTDLELTASADGYLILNAHTGDEHSVKQRISVGGVNQTLKAVQSYMGVKNLLPIPNFYAVIGHESRMHIKPLSWTMVDQYVYERVGSGTLGDRYLSFEGITDERDASVSLKRLYRTNPTTLESVMKYNLKIVQETAKSGQTISVMVIGDSTVAAGVTVAQLAKFCAAGSVTLNMVGTLDVNAKDSDGVSHSLKLEGRSGWSTNAYCHQASYGDRTNPFYNSGFDFSNYMTQNGLSAPNWVFIQLGINDFYDAGNHTTSENIQTMIDSIHAYNANIKIGVCLLLPPYLGEGCTLQAKAMHLDRLGVNNQLISDLSGQTNVYIVPINVALDPDYGFPTAQEAISEWITTTATKATDETHPSDAGYYQIAEMYFATLLCN